MIAWLRRLFKAIWPHKSVWHVRVTRVDDGGESDVEIWKLVGYQGKFGMVSRYRDEEDEVEISEFVFKAYDDEDAFRQAFSRLFPSEDCPL